MNLFNPEELKTFMRSQGLKPRDYLGQNFLVDEEVLKNIVVAADLKKSDTVLEVGPGLGVLTGELAVNVKKLVAVEKDEKLVPLLERQFKELPHVQIVQQDILRFHLEKYITGPYKVVANIPYYLTSVLLQTFLEKENQPECLVLMVQKEVGERVVAEAGELSVLGISVQIYADAEIVLDVPKECFWPVPKVNSVVIKITPRNKYPEIEDKKLFFRIVKMAFAGKRKQIHNTIGNGFGLDKEKVTEILTESKIDGVMRPQDLEIGDWIRLYQIVQTKK